MSVCPKCKVVLEMIEGYNPPIWSCEGCGALFMDLPKQATPETVETTEEPSPEQNPPEFTERDGSFDKMEWETTPEENPKGRDDILKCECGEEIEVEPEDWEFEESSYDAGGHIYKSGGEVKCPKCGREWEYESSGVARGWDDPVENIMVDDYWPKGSENPLLEEPLICKKCGMRTRFVEWMHKIADGWLCDECHAAPNPGAVESFCPVCKKDTIHDQKFTDLSDPGLAQEETLKCRECGNRKLVEDNPQENPSFTTWVFKDGATKGVFVTHKHDETAKKCVETALNSIISSGQVSIHPYKDKGIIGYEITVPGEIPKETLKSLEKETHKNLAEALKPKDYKFTPN